MFLDHDELAGKPCGDGLDRVAAGEYQPADLAWVIRYWANPKMISLELLIELLADKHYSVRRACAMALGNLGDPIAIPHLLQALESNKNCFVRRECERALGKIQDKQAKEG